MYTMQAYYRYPNLPNNDIYNGIPPLQVNCTGLSVYQTDVRANSVRYDYYLMYIISGNITLSAPVRSQEPMGAGTLIVFESNSPFEYHHTNTIKLVYYWIHFTGHDAAKLLADCRIATNTVYRVGNCEGAVVSFGRIFEAFTLRDAYFDLETDKELRGILIALGRIVSGDYTAAKQKEQSLISRSVKYIHENLSENITVPKLAEREFLSASRYHAVFRKAMGISPQDYIISLRMNRARELLEQTTLRIGEISDQLGYRDQRYFSRIFTKQVGVTPTEYRAKR